MTYRPFYSKAENYQGNVIDGQNASAGPATLASPTGPEPGVIIRRGAQISFVIPINDALRLANDIADSVEAHDQAAA